MAINCIGCEQVIFVGDDWCWNEHGNFHIKCSMLAKNKYMGYQEEQVNGTAKRLNMESKSDYRYRIEFNKETEFWEVWSCGVGATPVYKDLNTREDALLIADAMNLATLRLKNGLSWLIEQIEGV